ncbi:MAG: dephospho-CoA kinase [Magnetococcales bacterium]|nr:dephospho-CoA kinase [Magnetococcales bacterium]
MNNRQLFIVGITGSMGCGKSAVTRLFSRLGARTLDADQLARQIMEPGEPGWQEVVAAFGEETLMDGESSGQNRPLDRKKLGILVFSDPQKRALLESIIHPKVEAAQAEVLYRWEREQSRDSDRIVVMEIPLLFESGADHRCDLTVTVTCGQQQMQRLSNRRGMSEQVKQAAIARQLSESEKIERADRTIDNGKSWKETEREVERLWQEVTLLANKPGSRVWPSHWHQDG